VTQADIRTDEIRVTLSPPEYTGLLTVTLVGDQENP
jgi:hypothetical protein